MASAAQPRLPSLAFDNIDLPIFLLPASDDTPAATVATAETAAPSAAAASSPKPARAPSPAASDSSSSVTTVPSPTPAAEVTRATSPVTAPGPSSVSSASPPSPISQPSPEVVHLTVPPRDPMRLRKKPVPSTAQRPDQQPAQQPRAASPAPSVPSHPIPAMQQAFAESLLEVTVSTTPGVSTKPKLRELDAKGRHDALIDADADAPPLYMSWRFRPSQAAHELRKLMAQISFGVYLLLNGMANSDQQVVDILQGHIDEVDEFLEVVGEDFDQATRDVKERIDLLKIPTDNMEVFEKMLEDRNFRAEIVEGNEKIEHVLARTTVALKQFEKDIEEGLLSTSEFAVYLAAQSEGTWRDDRQEVMDIYAAMKCNTDGWFTAFKNLQTKGKALNALVTQLSAIVATMDKKAGEVSRRTWASIPPFTLPLHSTSTPTSSPPGSRWSNSVTQSPDRDTRIVSITPSVFPMPATHTTYFELPPREPALQPLSSREDEESDISTPRPQIETGSTTPDGDSDDDPKLPDEEELEEEEETSAHSPGFQHSPVDDDGPLYILQPRTYTPQPPEPLPSPMVRDPPASILTDGGSSRSSTPPVPPHKRSSLRERVSLKTNPPDSILIPPPNIEATRRVAHPSPHQAGYQPAPDSAYGSDVDYRTRFSSATTDVGAGRFSSATTSDAVGRFSSATTEAGRYSSATDVGRFSAAAPDPSRFSSATADLSPRGGASFVGSRPPPGGIIPSPRSDQQFFRPVRPVQASPHSPLQQRPQTAGANPRGMPPPFGHNGGSSQPGSPSSGYYPGHVRNAPSRMGGASMLSNVTTMTYDGDSSTVHGGSGDKNRLKKKRSAFGWLKKAFALDEEERAAFEAKKQSQHQNLYYDGRSGTFLDGRRVK